MSRTKRTPPFGVDRLRLLVSYDPLTGIFRSRVNRKQIKIGDLLGTARDSGGYPMIMIDSFRCKTSQLAWFYMTGGWPPYEIDHRNLDRADASFRNLRPATRSQNAANTPVRSSRPGALKGAYPRSNGRWVSLISANGGAIYLGSYATAEEAHAAYREAALRFFGEFARTD